MIRKVSIKDKKEILDLFSQGSSIKEISQIYNFSTQTITKQLKILLGIEEFKKIKTLIKSKNLISDKFAIKSLIEDIDQENIPKDSKVIINEDFINETFFEVPPITNDIDFENQKDFSSEPLQDVKLPQVLYLLVDSKIELCPKFLKDFPEWSFLPESDLKRKTIQIFSDQKEARKYCSNNQKAIKVPNSNIFLLVKDSLKKKGISRIIFDESLFSL